MITIALSPLNLFFMGGKDINKSTEEKIKAAARTVLYKKGFAATRTRDIAEEAGMNLALINYYFRSKKKLFEIIMSETIAVFAGKLMQILNDQATSLEKKIELIAACYIDMFTEEPEMPTFIVSEIRNHPEAMLKRIPVKQAFSQSYFIKQFELAVAAGKVTEPNPFHFIMNLLGLIVFPFIGKPMLMASAGLNKTQFNQLMQERKKSIPIWIKAVIKAT